MAEPYRRYDRTVKNYGVILFPDFQLQDAAGLIDSLQLLARSTNINLYTIAATMGSVPTIPHDPSVNVKNSSASLGIQATHTLSNAPDLDVLIVPGGAAVHFLNTSNIEAFIRKTYPKLQYLLTVCTGAGIAARSGVLDNHRATTNKAA